MQIKKMNCKHIWNIAEELRGKVDGWDFKGYVLGFHFINIFLKIFVNILMKLNENQELKILIMHFAMMTR